MRFRARWARGCILLAAVALAAAALPATGGSPSAQASSPSTSAAAPVVALLAGRPNALHTSLYLARAGEAGAPAPVATFAHLEGAVVRGSVLPGTTTVLAIADTRPARDLSFAASLFRLEPHAPPALLVDGVVHASRPLCTASGRVFVARGVAGPSHSPDPGQGQLRVDELTIDEIDPATGDATPRHAFTGFLTFLAGIFGDELIVYRVGPAGADLVAVGADGGAVRTLLASLPPFARDFSVDAARGALVFQNRHETDTRRWVVDRLDLVGTGGTGAQRTRVFEGASMNLAPYAWPDGRVALHADGRSGLALAGSALAGGALGPGVDWVRAQAPGGAHLAALHTVPSTLPVPFVIDTASGAAMRLAAPDGARVEIAGFVPAGDAP